jgi:hypothetical protein
MLAMKTQMVYRTFLVKQCNMCFHNHLVTGPQDPIRMKRPLVSLGTQTWASSVEHVLACQEQCQKFGLVWFGLA